MTGSQARSTADRSKLRRVIQVAGSLLIGLVLVELGLRALGLAASVDVGSSTRRNPSEYTILCLGDSWTHGLGSVSYGEALEAKLNAAAGDGKTYRVVRSGIPGSNSSQGLRRLVRLLHDENYDMLIVLLGNNDHQNLADSEYWRFDDEPGLGSRWYARGRVFTHSLRTYKLARTVQFQLMGRPTLDDYFFADNPNAPPKHAVIPLGPHRRQLEHNLTEIVSQARIHDVELVFMTYFYFHGYQVNESIIDVAMTHGAEVVNNTVLFHQRIPENRRTEHFFGAHPTTEGHAFIADNIIEFVDFH